jgi:hypothetical protein
MQCSILLVDLFLVVASANRAPDEAPDLPEGWCTPIYGTATRTTAECMCRYECQGPGCKREQGFVWYSGLTCAAPKCQCLDHADTAVKQEQEKKEQPAGSSSTSSSGGGEKTNSGGPRPASRRRSSSEETREVPPEFHKEVDESSIFVSALYWLEDNFNLVFAAVVVIIVITLIVFVGLLGGPLTAAQRGTAAAAASPRSAPKESLTTQSEDSFIKPKMKEVSKKSD